MTIQSVTAVHPMESNFLVPNGTFLVSLLAFAILVWIFGKYLIPPINKAMTARQEAIRTEFAELDDAKAGALQAEADYKEQLNNAKHEAARIREDAREHGAQIVQDAREKAQVEADRKSAFASLRRDVGSLATTLAGRIVGESMDDDERQGRVVERFLADLEETG